jgi:GTP cyclohydrolase II
MKKYIVETISTFRNVHVIEAENEDHLLQIADECDPNWDDWLGSIKHDVTEYSEEAIAKYKNKKYFWDGSVFVDDEGYVCYRDQDGNVRKSSLHKIDLNS